METAGPVILIDADTRRRAAICHTFAGSGYHVEPFEHLGELERSWPRTGVILAHDDNDVIAELVRRMSATGAWLPLVAFAQNPTPHRIVEAVLEGAVDYLAWPFDHDELDLMLHTALTRSTGLGNIRLREVMARGRIERLTRREREVLVGVANGMSNRRIGDKLCISPRTVEIHRANMLTKMGANHTSDAIRIAIEAALVD